MISQMNPTVGAISDNYSMIKSIYQTACEKNADILILSELAVCGYPPEDLILMPEFQLQAMQATKELVKATENMTCAILFGNLHKSDEGKLTNAAILAADGNVLGITHKHHLPNYGIFDEKRLFSQGPLPKPITYKGWKLGVIVCEDMWDKGPVETLGPEVDALISVNASPFEQGKWSRRKKLAKNYAAQYEIPLLYVNQVGGQDGIVFDGGSFVMASDASIAHHSPFFTVDNSIVTITKDAQITSITHKAEQEENPHSLTYQAMMVGLRDYVEKNHFPGVLIGLSGGIDSALSAAVAVDALGKGRVRCVMLPSPYTSGESLEDAKACAAQLGVTLESLPIQPLMDVTDMTLSGVLAANHPGIVEENIQSRIRGLLLMAMSNATGEMLLTTGNKSEMAVGYATLYGDMCGGFNVLKDLYKTQVFELSAWRNQNVPPQGQGPDTVVIPVPMLTKAPSAELSEGQKDEDTLPPYETLDAILHGLIEERKSPATLLKAGFDKKTIEQVIKLLYGAEYKRRQSPPGVKLTPMQFGLDRRYPMTNRFIKELC